MRPKPSRQSSQQDVASRANSSPTNQTWGSSSSSSPSSSSAAQLNHQASQISNSIFNNSTNGVQHQHQNQYQQQQQQQQQLQFQPEEENNLACGAASSKINKVYSIDELTQIWSSIQDELQKKGYDEKYRSLAPIRQLIDQVENDRQLQKQYQQQQQLQQQQQQSAGYAKRFDSNNNINSNSSAAQVSQLTDKLNEFGNWAKTESSLDFTSILNKVSSSSNLLNSTIGMKANSPFSSKPMLHRDSSFHSIHSPLTTHRSLSSQSSFLPQSAPAPTPPHPATPPADVKWYYLDTNGNQQGPFTGDLMQSWYSGGYFVPSLNVRCEDEASYRTLEDLTNLVNNHEAPFLTPLPTVVAPAIHNIATPIATPMATTPSFSAFAQFDGLNGHQQLYQTNATFTNPLAPQPQIPQLQQSQQSGGWASQSGRASPWALNSSTNLHDLGGANEFRLGAHSPFLSNSSAFLNNDSNSLLRQQQTAASSTLAHDDGLLQQINSQVFESSYNSNGSIQVGSVAVTNTTIDSTDPVSQAINVSLNQEATTVSTPVPAPAPVQTQTQTQTTTKEPVSAPAPIPAPTQTQAPSSMQEALTEAKQLASKTDSRPKTLSTRSSLSKARSEKKEVKKLVSESSKSEAEPVKSKPQLAPWANKTTTVQNGKPQLTLQEIQEMEAKESAKQSKLKAEKDRLVAAQLYAAAEREAEIASQKSASLPTTSSWGKPVVKTAAPSKTLLDIQREEAEAEAKAAAAAAKLAANNAKVPLAAAPPKNSFASVVTPQNSNPWTTIATKKPAPVAKPTPKVSYASSAKINPDVLRSVSAQPVAAQPAVSSSSSFAASSSSSRTSPRQEFLSWCRSSMKLNRGINENEVLQILLMLPLGYESQEIIADTIYSNSTTMDGRRFAQEFLKRRKTVEDQINDGLSWNDALHISVEDDNDGWDFQVVGKKHKRKN